MAFYAVKQKRLFDSVVELAKLGFDDESLPLLRTMYESNIQLPCNARCGCGSNKEYRHCCMNKEYRYFVESDGKTIKRIISLGKQSIGLLKKSEHEFKKKLGMEIGPNDKAFWEVVDFMNSFKDQDAYMASYTRELLKAGMHKHLVYATLKTYGMILTEENRGLFKDRDIEEYEGYSREYLKKSKKDSAFLEKEFKRFEIRSQMGEGKPWPQTKIASDKKSNNISIKKSK